MRRMSNNSTRDSRTYTRRQFLTYRVVMDGVPIWQAHEAVSSTALEHPEWDMDEEMTWEQWEAAQR